MRLRVVSILLLALSLLMVSMALISCAPDTSAPVLPDIEASDISTPDSVSVAAVPEVVSLPGTLVPTVEPFTDTECLDCHTDQEKLIELALPEEEEDSLSSGPG